jgi:glutathione-regulated potassium-efflux system ancillary protein KefC
MQGISLTELFVLLCAAMVVVSITRRLGLGVLPGYLIAGILIGPSTVGWIFSDYEVKELQETSESVLMLLFFVLGLGTQFRIILSEHRRILVLGLL